jgi:hypothetical protein
VNGDVVLLPPVAMPNKSLTQRLQDDVAEGLRVLWKRDGVWISEDQIQDRARNIVQGLITNYRVEDLS